VQFCIKISRLTDQLKNLSQENALMKLEIENLAQNAQHMRIEEQSSDSGLKPAENH
jgi:regulator of replication initiation timing